MSEQCRDWTRIENPGQSVGWRCNTHGDGYYVGDRSPYLCRAGRGAETVHILTDLIAELRDVFGTDAEAYGERIGTFPIGSHGDEVRQYIDRAEVQLRTLQTSGGSAGADLKEGEGSGDE